MIRIGNRVIKTFLKEGIYKARINGITEAPEVEKDGVRMPAIDIEYEIEINNSYLKKDKKYIVSSTKGSELRNLIEELIPESNFEDGVDLESLIGKKCSVKIIHNISKRGNLFENISTVKVDVNE